MSNPVVFSPEVAKRVTAATRKVEQTATNRGGAASTSYDAGAGFWAMILGSDVSGLRYTFNKVVFDPRSTYPQAFTIMQTERFGFDGPPSPGVAIEVNGNRGVQFKVVFLRFAGYDLDGTTPVFLFSYNEMVDSGILSPHDHRDNANGGFAFAVYHPGSSIPQMPWAE